MKIGIIDLVSFPLLRQRRRH